MKDEKKIMSGIESERWESRRVLLFDILFIGESKCMGRSNRVAEKQSEERIKKCKTSF